MQEPEFVPTQQKPKLAHPQMMQESEIVTAPQKVYQKPPVQAPSQRPPVQAFS